MSQSGGEKVTARDRSADASMAVAHTVADRGIIDPGVHVQPIGQPFDSHASKHVSDHQVSAAWPRGAGPGRCARPTSRCPPTPSPPRPRPPRATCHDAARTSDNSAPSPPRMLIPPERADKRLIEDVPSMLFVKKNGGW